MIITFRVDENIGCLFKAYAKEKEISLSALLRESLMEKIAKENRMFCDDARREQEEKAKSDARTK